MADEISPAVAAPLAAALLGPGMDVKSAAAIYYAVLDALGEKQKERRLQREESREPRRQPKVIRGYQDSKSKQKPRPE